ncbi:FAD-binding oxidoreductase [Candidatus Daviesbacteria bacterium]|nr:FAD-binding oxidoreductase [Candidatus Daviesbacteria bacterium]
MDTVTLTKKIQEFFKGEILSDPKALKFYSHDTSLFEVVPQLIVFPLDSEDVSNLVKFVSENKQDFPHLSLTARSGGTDMTGGAINDSIIVDFSKHFSQIGEIRAEGTVVQPGVFYRDFEKLTLEKGLFLPSYPASKNICALGGMISNNAGGEKTLAHGKTIDYVENLKIILADGNEYSFEKLTYQQLLKKIRQDDFEGRIYKKIFQLCEENYELIKQSKPDVSKNSTGFNIWDVWDKEKKEFDLTKIFIGAQGTLGINIEAKLRLIEAKKHNGLLVIYLNDMSILPQIINDVLLSKPESFEVFDDRTLSLALKFMPQFIKILGLKGTIDMGLQFLPDLINFATKGLPKFTLLVEFDSDNPTDISQRIEKLKSILSKYPVRIELAETDKKALNFWTIRRESFNLLRKNVKNKHTAPFIDDFIVKPLYLLEFFPKLIKILVENQIDYTIAGHMGDGNFHIIPLMDFRNKKEIEKIPVVEEKVNQLVFDYHGSISAEHNEGMIRGYYLEKMYGSKMFEIFKKIKHILDPEDIFNPHKKTDANLNYSLSHIRNHF